MTTPVDLTGEHVYGTEVERDANGNIRILEGSCSNNLPTCINPSSNICHGAYLCFGCLAAHGGEVRAAGGTFTFGGTLRVIEAPGEGGEGEPTPPADPQPGGEG